MVEHRISRRGFVKAVGTGAAVGVLGRRWASPVWGAEGDQQPLFRFVQWNDIHLDASRPQGYRRADEKLAYLVDWANAAARRGECDFVLGIGDLIHGGNLASLSEDAAKLKRMIASLKPPLRPVLGNHENLLREGDLVYEKPFCEACGLTQTNYTFSHKGLLFVMLNDTGDPAASRQPVGRKRNAWVRRVLEESPDAPKIICCHLPLVPVREEKVLAKSFGFKNPTAGDEELLGLVDKHAKSIVAVLSGHLHLTGYVRRKGVYHVSISGTASYPCDFATYDVFPDRIRVQVRSLPEKLVTPETNIHGRPRYKTDYTDAAHPTAESYVKGNASERDFTMPMHGLRKGG
jgi:hypothetical protein